MKKIIILFILITLFSCKESVKIENQKSINSTFVEQNITTDDTKVIENKTDSFYFVEYNDYGDYMLLNAEKEKKIYSFINDRNEDRSLLRGDFIEIKWEEDTIYIAGDGDTPEIADWLISVNKIQDGNVSNFRKKYKNPIQYYLDEDFNSYNDVEDNFYFLLVEYYLANSKKELVKMNLKNNAKLMYTIGSETRENKKYTTLRICNDLETHISTIQWIYYDNYEGKLYEYDLQNDKLIEFN